MTDVVSPEVRSRMMSGIRSRDTRQEVKIRKALHAAGFRYRLHSKNVPGKPDITLPRHRAVIFVHGCFWHGHDCHLFKWPSTRAEFWFRKISGNQVRDKQVRAQLSETNWRYLVIWECAIKGKGKLPFDGLISQVNDWICGAKGDMEITGK